MNNPQLIFENAYGQVVVKPERGCLSYYDEKSGRLLPYAFYEGNERKVFSPTNIKKYIVDHNKNLWLLSEHELLCVTFHPELFILRHNYANLECRLLGLTLSGDVWASDRSLSLYSMDTNGSCSYFTKSGAMQSQPTSVFGRTAYSFLQDSDGRVWVGTKGDGLYLFTPTVDRKAYNVEHFLHDGNMSGSLCSDTIYAMFQDSRKRIWLGSYGSGVFSASFRNGKWLFKRVNGIPMDAKVRCFLEPQRDVLLIGTTNGLLSVNMRNDAKITCHINSFRQEPWGLQGNDIMKILQCNGKVYLCVFSSGISEITSHGYLSDNLHFKTYPIMAEATADQIKSATTEGTSIWVVSDRSITKFSTIDKTSITFDRSCMTDDVNFSEATPIVQGNNIIVGTSKGTMTFDTGIANVGVRGDRLVFTGIQYANDMNIRPLNDIDSLTIRPEERSFSLYVSPLDYGWKENTKFRYKMLGYSEEWNYTSENQHAIFYGNISPGHYTLVVETYGKDGKWGNAQRRIPVVVTPKFIETVWFNILLSIIIVGVFIGLVYAVVYLSHMRKSLQKRYSLLMTVDKMSGEMESHEQLEIKDDSDKAFLENNIRFLEDNIAKDRLAVDDFARHLGMSRTAYYNKMKELTGLSPIEFIRQLRIKKALRLVESGKYTIAEVAYMTGFNDPKYFSRCFKAEMGMSPTAYMDSCERDNSETTIM